MFSCGQGEEPWLMGKGGEYGEASLPVGIAECKSALLITSEGKDVMRLTGFVVNVGIPDEFVKAGGGASRHTDGTKQGARSRRQ